MKCRLAPLILLAACTISPEQANMQTTVYPPGRWRLASERQLAQTMVYASHILIQHTEGQNDDVCFSLADFHSTGPAPTRTREQARELAERVAEQARATPASFASLAREHSEDIVRRDQGGSLGYTTALQLTPWAEVLDALAALKAGQISAAVETTCGFHVLYRAAPPPLEIVSGVRVVIGHEKAGWLRVVAQPSARSREDALALAWQLHAQVSKYPEQFSDLVQRHSESLEAIIGGDLGTWSTREPSVYPSEVEVLSKLPIGGIAPPMDSLFGIEILMRTPNRARAHLALEGVRLYYDRNAGIGSPESPERVLELARAKIAELDESLGGRADALFRQHWVEGRGEPALTAALLRLDVGERLPEPVPSPNSYVVGRRIEPPPLETAEALLDLSSPVSSIFAR